MYVQYTVGRLLLFWRNFLSFEVLLHWLMIKNIAQRAAAFEKLWFLRVVFKVAAKTDNVVINRAG